MIEERKQLNEENLENVVGGTMTFSDAMGEMRYLEPDGKTYSFYPLLKSGTEGYQRSLALHMKTDDEDYILSVLQAEGYVGKKLRSKPV